jgi:hypothetical protein
VTPIHVLAAAAGASLGVLAVLLTRSRATAPVPSTTPAA